MVVVRIESWPNGDYKQSRLLGVCAIANDGTGDEKRGNYDVQLSHAGRFINKKTGPWKKGKVERHKRKLSPYHLVFAALKAALKLK